MLKDHFTIHLWAPALRLSIAKSQHVSEGVLVTSNSAIFVVTLPSGTTWRYLASMGTVAPSARGPLVRVIESLMDELEKLHMLTLHC